MPKVGKQHFPYTKEGYARAEAAKAMLSKKKSKPKKKAGTKK